VDLATIVGSILAWSFILIAILIGGSSVMMYFDPPSVMVVLGGTVAVILVAFPMTVVKKLPAIIMKSIFAKPTEPQELITKLVEFAEVARRDGILSLEAAASEVDDPFIKRGIQMAVDGTDPELIEVIMEAELDNQVMRHQQGKSLLDGLGKYAPALGMIGTLLGLIAMLANMDDPSSIGAGMSVALITTLYGALIANLIFLPMADKLALRSSEEILAKTIVIQGVMAIQSGDNPRIVEQKLLTFIPPASRVTEEEKAAA